MRTAIKRFIKALGGDDVDTARTAYRQATSLIDRSVSKHLHNRNRAARLKRRLNARLKNFTPAS